jgi:MazG family protein
VVEAVTAKMIRRHPHVFGDTDARAAGLPSGAWERRKTEERAASGGGLMDGIPVSFPALARAVKLQKRAASVGFDWPGVPAIMDKLREETVELDAELAADAPDLGRIEDEIGDLLFTVTNLARRLGVDPDRAARLASAKFQRRFAVIEATLAAAGRRPSDATLDEMDRIWSAAKASEKR